MKPVPGSVEAELEDLRARGRELRGAVLDALLAGWLGRLLTFWAGRHAVLLGAMIVGLCFQLGILGVVFYRLLYP